MFFSIYGVKSFVLFIFILFGFLKNQLLNGKASIFFFTFHPLYLIYPNIKWIVRINTYLSSNLNWFTLDGGASSIFLVLFFRILLDGN